MTTLYDIHRMELELAALQVEYHRQALEAEALRKENAALRQELIAERTLTAELTEMIEGNGVLRAVLGGNTLRGNMLGGTND